MIDITAQIFIYQEVFFALIFTKFEFFLGVVDTLGIGFTPYGKRCVAQGPRQ